MKKSALTAILISSLITFTGCSGASAPSDKMAMEESMAYFSTTAENGILYDSNAKYSGAGMTMHEEPEAEINDLAERKIIKTANLSFETEKYDDLLPSMESCIASLGGYIESSESYGGGISSSGSRNSHITARIPESNYSRFMNEITELGTLTYKSESSDDVTLSYVDTESRLKSLQTEYNALIEILEKATSLDDVIQLQSRISEVTYQIESYQSQLRKYDDLIAYCTVHIDISEVRRITQNEDEMSVGERMVSGLKNTFSDLGDDLSDFSVWFVVNIPYLIIWAAIITASVIIIRLKIKKHRKKKEQKLIDSIIANSNEKNI